LLSSAAGLLLTESAKANPLGFKYPSFPNITINADGTITPTTDMISRNGNVYTLNLDVNGTQIMLECSNIVFDGNGHSITIMGGTGMNPGILLYNSTNTTIENVQVFTNLYTGIKMSYCTSCNIKSIKTSGQIELGTSNNNTITKNIGPVYINYGSKYNRIFGNNITDELAISYFSGQNVIYGNNILLDINNPPYVASGNVWDNGSTGNYWSTYKSVYSNASEVGQTGIGNTPYVLDADNIDHYPAISPFNMETGTIALPNRELSPPSSIAEISLAIGLFIVFIIAVTAVLLMHHRTHKKAIINQTGDFEK
jgi:parallel beta-helix repeat protein